MEGETDFQDFRLEIVERDAVQDSQRVVCFAQFTQNLGVSEQHLNIVRVQLLGFLQVACGFFESALSARFHTSGNVSREGAFLISKFLVNLAGPSVKRSALRVDFADL